MNALLRVSVVLLFSCAGLAIATENAVQVAASRELRLAVVDTSKSSKTREALHAAFADSLSEAVGKQVGGNVGIRAKSVGADQAAFNLGTGVYDAVLVINTSLPRPLMISDVVRLVATLGSGKNEKKLYLIFNTNNTTLSDLLSASFPVALNNPKFLDVLDDTAGRPPTTGEKMASASP